MPGKYRATSGVLVKLPPFAFRHRREIVEGGLSVETVLSFTAFWRCLEITYLGPHRR